MLESALEQLLLQFLEPYVEGISRDKLHLGVFRGSLELRDLRVKPDALSLLGIEGFRVRRGSLALIQLAVPWTKLYTGKLRARVHTVHLEVEQIAESWSPDRADDGPSAAAKFAEEVREMKRRAIDLRVTQLTDLLEQQRQLRDPADAAAEGVGEGLAVKLMRKILNNIQIELKDVRVSLVSDRHRLAIAAELPALDVLSTDQTFRERPESEEVVVSGYSMYKLLRVRGFGLCVSRGEGATSGSVKGTPDFVLCPMNARLKLAHVPSDQILRLRLEVATDEIAELTLTRSQARQLLRAYAAASADAEWLYRLMVPRDAEMSILADPAAAGAEYGRLYERLHLHERRLADRTVRPLSPDDAARIQLLEDALSVRLLARERWKVRSKADEQSRELARRVQDIERARQFEEQRRAGLIKRVAGALKTSGTAGVTGEAGGGPAVSATPLAVPPRDRGQDHRRGPIRAVWISDEEQAQLVRDMEDEAKVESVDLPQRLKFEFALGKVSLDLVDDRWPGGVQRQLLSLALQEADLTVDVDMADHRGQDSYEWRLECGLLTFRAIHAGRSVFRFSPTALAGEGDDCPQEASCDPMDRADGVGATRLVLTSRLEEGQNLLSMRVDFAPLEVHALPGVLERLFEFSRTPTDALRRTVPESPQRSSTGRGVDLPAEVAEMVYEQIPDRLHLEVRMTSSVVHVPVDSLGVATFSLDGLLLETPKPCEYNSVGFDIRVTRAALSAVSCRGERFSVLQPVPIDVHVDYSCSDLETAMDVQATISEAVLVLTPKALQILLAAPAALAAMVTPPEEEPPATELREGESFEAESLEVGQPEVEPPCAPTAEAEKPAQPQPTPPDAVGASGSEEQQWRVHFVLNLSAFDLTLTDSIAPIARLRAEMLSPGLRFYQQLIPYIYSVDVDRGALEAEVFDSQKGAWEPVLERFGFGFQVVRTPEGELGSATRVVLNAQDPLLMNLTPAAVRTIAGIIPHFSASVLGVPTEPPADSHGSPCDGARYRVVNLCDHPLEVEFKSRHHAQLALQVKPSGSEWESLDDWVLPHFATAVVVRLPGGHSSAPLPLERAGIAVEVPGSGIVAELLAPSPAQRLLLLAAPLRVHNRTDLTLLVRFHDAVQREVLMVDVPPTSACDASVLGWSPPLGETRHEYEERDLACDAAASPRVVGAEGISPCSAGSSPHRGSPFAAVATETHQLLLPPHCLCTIPPIALARARATDGAPRAWLSIRPMGLRTDFCKPTKVGGSMAPHVAQCSVRDGIPAGRELANSDEDVNFLFVAEASAKQSPVVSAPVGADAPVAVATVAIRPTLTLLNALPTMDLVVAYTAPADASADPRSWPQVTVPARTRVNLYSFGGVPSEGARIRARLQPRAPEVSRAPNHVAIGCDVAGDAAAEPPWSAVACLRRRVFDDCGSVASGNIAAGDERDDGGRESALELRSKACGASCAFIVETISHSEVRLSCPHWFADRSGLGRPLTLELQHGGRPLPSSAGLTFLPPDCFEADCEVLLRSTCSVLASRSVRIPSNWGVLPWCTHCGAFVFSTQTERLEAGDLFGAKCQVTTLRPRLVLTNASKTADLELRLPGGKRLRLGASQCLEAHWQAATDEELPSMSVRFRPIRCPSCTWSGVAVCGEAAAGVTPFLLRSGGNGEAETSDGSGSTAVTASGASGTCGAALGFEVWSVEVAPGNGALAVTFREGSEFVAVNQALRAGLTMIVRPLSRGSGGTVIAGQHRGAGLGATAATTTDITLPPGSEAPYGWFGLCHGERERAVDVLVGGLRCHVSDVRQTARRHLRNLGVVLAAVREGARTLLRLEDTDLPHSATRSEPPSSSWLQRIDVRLGRVGLSIVGGAPRPHELMYVHLDLVRLEWSQSEGDVQELKLAISDAQVDCQLPGRVDARTADPRRGDSLGLLQRERPAAILANCAKGDRAFLSLYVRFGATTSPDLVVQHVEVAMDELDVTIDDDWLEPLARFLLQATAATSGPSAASDERDHGGGVSLAHVVATAGRPIEEGYTPPPLPPVIQIDSMHVSGVQLTVWCALRIRGAHFLPPYLRTALRVLSLSGHLTLDGASLRLAPRSLPPHRGSLGDFTWGLASEYAVALLQNAGAVLGKSSVLNVPRAPLKVGGTAVSYVTDSIGLAAGEAACLLGQLTFDEEYIAQQRRIRSAKQIHGFGDGVVEAGKSLAQGVEGLLDVVRKPAEGARHGLGGLLSGVGRGVAGGFMKPISKLGQAISDVGAGIAAQATPDSTSSKRRRMRCRQRLPRLLFSSRGAVRQWSTLEAELLAQLGARLTSGVEEVVPLTLQGSHRMVLLLFGWRLVVAEVRAPLEQCRPDPRGHSAGVPINSTSSDRRSPRSSTGAAVRSGPDLFDAVDQTASKLVLQALKPVNTVLYGMQDIERQLTGRRSSKSSHDGVGDAAVCRRARELRFSELRAVHASEDGHMVQLEDSQGSLIALPLFAALLGPTSREALISGFRSALAPRVGEGDSGGASGVASWEELSAALRAEQRANRLGAAGSAPSGGGPNVVATASQTQRRARDGDRVPLAVANPQGQRALEVLEVERRVLGSATWCTPFLPTDGDLTWRWVDATGSRHPHLLPDLRREVAVAQRTPPCRLDTLFHFTSEWAVDHAPGTDEQGWRYGLAWNVSTWDPEPGLLDVLRRRRWTRTYS